MYAREYVDIVKNYVSEWYTEVIYSRALSQSYIVIKLNLPFTFTLQGYIDRVRQLQKENYTLTRQIKTFEEHQSTEISQVKDMYNQQIEDLKAALESMNKQYNQLKVGAEGLLTENEDIKGKLKKKDNDLTTANGRIHDLEDEMRGLVHKLSRLESEKTTMATQLNEVLPEVTALREKLAEAKRSLDEEQLKSADLDNTCARLEEDLKFKMQLLEKELMEVKQRKEVEITEMDGKLQEEYEDRLQKALEELREVYDSRMKQSRDDFEKIYEDRVRDLQSQLSNSRGSNASTLQELKESKVRIATLISKVSDLEGANLALNQKIADLAQEMEDLKSTYRAQLAAKDDEIKRLLDELTNQLKEYQNLQVINVFCIFILTVPLENFSGKENHFDYWVKQTGSIKEKSANYGIRWRIRPKDDVLQRNFILDFQAQFLSIQC